MPSTCSDSEGEPQIHRKARRAEGAKPSSGAGTTYKLVKVQVTYL